MNWRLENAWIEGELDNTVPGRITGHIYFNYGRKLEKVDFDLFGNFEEDLKGKKVHLKNNRTVYPMRTEQMASFAKMQLGELNRFNKTGYFEWHSKTNGRVSFAMAPTCITVEVRDTVPPSVESETRRTVLGISESQIREILKPTLDPQPQPIGLMSVKPPPVYMAPSRRELRASSELTELNSEVVLTKDVDSSGEDSTSFVVYDVSDYELDMLAHFVNALRQNR